MSSMKIYRMPLEGGKRVPIPEYGTSGAACFDLYTANTERLVLEPHKITKVPLGIKVAVETGWELKIYPRSGLTAKGIISVAQGTGHIDSDYRGEVAVLCYNTTDEPYTVEPFSRLAQGKIEEAPHYRISEVFDEEDLGNTKRGSGGFGSTGVSQNA